MQATNHNLQFTDGVSVIEDIPFKRPLSSNNKGKATEKEVTDAVGKWSIPDAHQSACMDLARRLHNNHPDWSPFKVARKVAEKYRLKELST